jgi:hypothetical protein
MLMQSKVRVVEEVELVGFDLKLGLDYSVVGNVLIGQMTASSDCGVLVGNVVYRIKFNRYSVNDFY